MPDRGALLHEAKATARSGAEIVAAWRRQQGRAFHFPFIAGADDSAGPDWFFPGDVVAFSGAAGSGKATAVRHAVLVALLPASWYVALDGPSQPRRRVDLGGHGTGVRYFDFGYGLQIAALAHAMRMWVERCVEQQCGAHAPLGLQAQVGALVARRLRRLDVHHVTRPEQILLTLMQSRRARAWAGGGLLVVGPLNAGESGGRHRPLAPETFTPFWWRRTGAAQAARVPGDAIRAWKAARRPATGRAVWPDPGSHGTAEPLAMLEVLSAILAHPVAQQHVILLSEEHVAWRDSGSVPTTVLASSLRAAGRLHRHYHFCLQRRHPECTIVGVRGVSQLGVSRQAKGVPLPARQFGVSNVGLVQLS